MATTQNASVEPPLDSGIYHTLEPTSRHIRLLHILPGNRTDDLSCRLSVVCLDDNPHYEALSYAWGTLIFCRPIFLNGVLHHITQNLDEALRRLRQPDRTLILWVDALCIDQFNSAERTHQVNMMGSIFSRTANAFLFLGDYDEGRLLPGSDNPTALSSEVAGESSSTATVVEALDTNRGNRLTRSEAIMAFAFIYKLSTDQHIALSSEEAESTRFIGSLRAVEKLVSLPWWNRIWTVQEAVLPPRATVVCGSIHIAWSVFKNASQNHHRHLFSCCKDIVAPDSLLEFRERVASLIHISWNRVNCLESDLFMTLHQFRIRQASDPRDKLFALLGLATSNGAEISINADYSLSIRQVYTNMMSQSIRSRRDLLPLLRPEELGRRPDLPSWVPDWSADTQELSQSAVLLSMLCYGSFNASKETNMVVYLSPEPVLALKGTMVDQVIVLGFSNLDGISIHSVVEQWKDLMNYEAVKHLQYVGGGRYEDAFWRLLAYDHAVITDSSSVRRTVPTDYGLFLRTFWTLGIQNFGCWTASDRRFFITEKGYISTGTTNTRIGNKVYILFGGKVPFLLRPAESPSSVPSFHYVGHAYVHGIMDGEALQNPDRQDEKVYLI